MVRRKKNTRSVNGILLFDKPKGLSSNAALQAVKRLYQASKAGHSGSLDPLATGLLPIFFGEATKVAGYLLNADKAYSAVCKLGVITASGDAEGEVIEERPLGNIKTAQIKTVLKQFKGHIQQIPPMYSALKHEGQRLYQLARRGETVEREPRDVFIKSIELTEMEMPFFTVNVACSKGTYIRTLVEDIGYNLGCGAHITSLIRVTAGPFQLKDALTYEQLEQYSDSGFEALDGELLTIDTALQHWPSIQLDSIMSDYIKQGQAVFIPQLPDVNQDYLRLYAESESGLQFIGIGHILDDGRVAPKRLIQSENVK